MFEVTTNIKQAFFNVDKVQDAIDREERTAMRKGAARIRRRQRAMILVRKGPSQPDEAPHAHTRNPIASPRYILFGYDKLTHSAVVGMVRISKSKVNGPKPLPALLEKGGRTVIRRRGRKPVSVQIRKRPSVVPATVAAASAGEIIDPWKGVITP